MASGGVNKVMLIGNLGRDPEIRYTQGGTAVVNLSLATTRRYRDRDGQNQEQTDWHRVVMFARLAEIAGEYLRKGQQIYIEGRLQTRQWQDNQGQTRYTTEVVANDMQMLGGGRGGGGGAGWDQDAGGGTQLDQTPAAGDEGQADFDQDFEDDIPF